MNPSILPLPFDPAKLRGLSERLLQSHHQNNYGGAVKRLQAIRAELAPLDWDAVALRYAAAVEASTSGLAVSADDMKTSTPVMRVDVRCKGAFEAAPDMIEGALWRDPERVDDWARELAGAEVLVYCVYGHEVGQSTAARLRDAGVSARYLTGGIEDWKKAGRPVQPK
jgi:Fe-Mn family superoxide dismutase